MNKKSIILLSIGIFFLLSINSISASSDITVKAIWDDSVQNARPNEISVSLVDNGKIVDTIKLNAENSWKGTFKVSDDGNYKIKVTNIKGYSSHISGNVENGFIITNKIIENEVLSSSSENNDDKVSNQISNDIISDNGTDSNTTNNQTEQNNNSATDNKTNENSAITKKSDKDNKNSTITKKSDKDNKNSAITKKSPSQVKKSSDVKKQQKKKTNTTTNKMKKTGLPIGGLVLIMFAAAFVPFSRKK